ncbi:MAG: cytochrome c biogenesis protein ResB [Pseudomonadota bacterium]
MSFSIKILGDTLSKPHIMFYALPWLMILLVAGTVAQKDMGLYEAVKLYFSSWIFWLGPIPLPGTLTTIAVIFINLSFKFLFKSTWSLEKAGINITHLGILLLILGGLVTALSMREGYMIIPEGHQTNFVYAYDEANQEVMIHKPPLFKLPFTLKLIDFEKQVHPATDIPRAFRSDLVITEGKTQWPVRIEMNKPLRFKGYTVFQSSFDEAEGVEVTVLSVVWNVGRLFPYIATFVIALGMALHIAIRIKRTRRHT